MKELCIHVTFNQQTVALESIDTSITPLRKGSNEFVEDLKNEGFTTKMARKRLCQAQFYSELYKTCVLRSSIWLEGQSDNLEAMKDIDEQAASLSYAAFALFLLNLNDELDDYTDEQLSEPNLLRMDVDAGEQINIDLGVLTDMDEYHRTIIENQKKIQEYISNNFYKKDVSSKIH